MAEPAPGVSFINLFNFPYAAACSPKATERAEISALCSNALGAFFTILFTTFWCCLGSTLKSPFLFIASVMFFSLAALCFFCSFAVAISWSNTTSASSAVLVAICKANSLNLATASSCLFLALAYLAVCLDSSYLPVPLGVAVSRKASFISLRAA